MLEFFYQVIKEASNGELLTFFGSVIGAILGVLIGVFIGGWKECREKKRYERKVVNALLYEIWSNGMKLWVVAENNVNKDFTEDNTGEFECDGWLNYKDDFVIKYNKKIKNKINSFYFYYQCIKDNKSIKIYDNKSLKVFLQLQINTMQSIKDIWRCENIFIKFDFEEFEKVLAGLIRIKQKLENEKEEAGAVHKSSRGKIKEKNH